MSGKNSHHGDWSARSKSDMRDILNYTDSIINHLPPDALSQLLEGYENDLDELLMSVMIEVDNVLKHGRRLDLPTGFDYLEKFETSFDESLKILSYNYFKITMLPTFNMGVRNIEWGNLIQLHPFSAYICSRGSGKSYEFCWAFPLWRLWSYFRPVYGDYETLDNKNRKETVIITNEMKLARHHLGKIVEEIRANDLLHERMLPDRLSDLGKDQIRTKNGAIIHLRSKDSFIRGLHLGAAVVDDFQDSSCIYSIDQREKFKETFYGDIMSIIEPGGYLLVPGTPFHDDDLFNSLRKDKQFKVFTYPAILPNGEILAPDRHSYKFLMERKSSLGTIWFSREYLCIPVSDASSLFPWDYLSKSFIGMENVSLVENIESYPIKLERVHVACDFAISGNISADYSVFSVWGVDSMSNYYLLYIWRKRGASHLEQVNEIVRLNTVFKPNKIVAESNGFQKVMISLIKERGITNIEEFQTDDIKKDFYQGLPSLSALFERGAIKIPYMEGKSRENAQWLCGEFNSISFNPDTGKLESTSGHDDGVMSSFFGIFSLREDSQVSGVRVSFID